MDMVDVISQLISNVGFPIAAFCLMFWMLNTTMKEMREASEQNTVAISELTAMVKTLIERLGEDDVV